MAEQGASQPRGKTKQVPWLRGVKWTRIPPFPLKSPSYRNRKYILRAMLCGESCSCRGAPPHYCTSTSDSNWEKKPQTNQHTDQATHKRGKSWRKGIEGDTGRKARGTTFLKIPSKHQPLKNRLRYCCLWESVRDAFGVLRSRRIRIISFSFHTRIYRGFYLPAQEQEVLHAGRTWKPRRPDCCWGNIDLNSNFLVTHRSV